MAKRIDKEDAQTIASKLQATIKPGAKHDVARIFHKNQFIAQFGIRRGHKSIPHDFIPSQIFLSQSDCKKMAACKLGRSDWEDRMKQLGKIAKEDE